MRGHPYRTNAWTPASMPRATVERRRRPYVASEPPVDWLARAVVALAALAVSVMLTWAGYSLGQTDGYWHARDEARSYGTTWPLDRHISERQ